MIIEVPEVSGSLLLHNALGEPTVSVARRVAAARDFAGERDPEAPVDAASDISGDGRARRLKAAIETQSLSARGFHRVLRGWREQSRTSKGRMASKDGILPRRWPIARCRCWRSPDVPPRWRPRSGRRRRSRQCQDFPHAGRRGDVDLRQIVADHIDADKQQPPAAKFGPDPLADFEVARRQTRWPPRCPRHGGLIAPRLPSAHGSPRRRRCRRRG